MAGQLGGYVLDDGQKPVQQGAHGGFYGRGEEQRQSLVYGQLAALGVVHSEAVQPLGQLLVASRDERHVGVLEQLVEVVQPETVGGRGVA